LAGSVANDPADRAGALRGKSTGSMNSRNFFGDLKRRTIYMMDSADVKFEIGNGLFVPSFAAKE
jgi:hypothetical protein